MAAIISHVSLSKNRGCLYRREAKTENNRSELLKQKQNSVNSIPKNCCKKPRFR